MTLHDYLSTTGLLDEEDGRLELKSAQGGVPKKMWQSVSAFANGRGGTVLLGVAPDKSVLGLEDPDRIQADVASTVGQVLSPSIEVVPSVVEIEGRRIVALHVPETEPHLKPVYITSQGVKHGAFKRVGSSDVRLTDEDLTRLAAERSGVSPDQQVPPKAKLDDLDEVLIRRYRTRLQAARPDSPLVGYDDIELLRGLGLLSEESDAPNRAGILLFGSQASMLRFFPGFAFQILEIDGTEWIPSADARPRTLAMPITGLVELASRISDELIGRIPEGVRIVRGSLQREADPVHVAVREGVVNALVHQDHLAFQPTQFRRFSDRLEMENPGTSKKSIRSFDRPGSSPRNPLLARAFNMVKLAEGVGSGILTMKRNFRNAGLAEPTFENDEEARQFQVRFYWHNLASEEEIRRVGAFGELNEDQKRALVFALRSGEIRNADYRELTGRDMIRASEGLRNLVELGFLEKRGKSRATHYVPTQKSDTARIDRDLLEPPEAGER